MPRGLRLNRRGFLLLVSLAPLAGCRLEPPPAGSFPDIGFAHLAPLRLDAARLEVVSSHLRSTEPPHVEHLMPEPPGEVVERWARQRLVPAGRSNGAVFLLREANVREVELPVTGGLLGWLKTEQSTRYDARVNATLSLYGEDGGLLASAESLAERSITVAEDASLLDRERVWFTLVERLVGDFDREMEKNIRASFGPYLLS